MVFIRKSFLLFLCLISGLTAEAVTSSRLLVSIDPSASFSAEQFAERSSAKLVQIDTRNPYKALQKVFLEEPFVVISEDLSGKDPGGDSPRINRLAARNGYRLVVFSQETLEEAWEISTHLLATSPKYSSDLPQLSVEEAQRLYTLLDKIDKVLTKNQIGYWTGRETLLGAIRHGGLIPWDDYLYLFMMDLDVKKLESAQEDFEEEGLVVHSYFKDFYKICEADGFPIENCRNPGSMQPFRYPAANLFVMTLEKRHEIEDVYVHLSSNFYFHWNHERFFYSQIENIHRVPFGPLLLPVPGDPELYLNQLFGSLQKPDLWKRHDVEFTWDHRRECHAPHRGAALVEVDNFEPAPW